MNTKNNFTIVVDEQISNVVIEAFQAFLEKRGFTNLKTYLIGENHPGMPDVQIIHHFLRKDTVFLTRDRPFRNRVLAQSLISFCYKTRRIS